MPDASDGGVMTIMEPSVAADVYAGRVARTLNSGFITLMISVGHRTGLFDVMAALPPATSPEIASAAGLAERYVREWLAALTSAHIVDYDARTGTYFLHIEYAAVLSRGAGPNNLAPAAQMLSLLAAAEDAVVAGFRGGGGVMPQAYERLGELLALEKRQRIDSSYVAALLELMPGMRERLQRGAMVLDVGCGDGALINLMARLFPRSAFRGCDVSAAAIQRAFELAAEGGVTNLELVIEDATHLDEPPVYELVLAFESLHEQSFPARVVRNIAAAVKHDGVFLVQEAAASSHLSRNVDHPFAPLLYAHSCMHAVPIALHDSRGEALGRMWGRERAGRLLAEAGFSEIRFETLPADPLSYYAVCRKA
jgi:2-polyprenyl-3-methyl-5-hydroxy-6-metoxy-1,4-benzoquinol methylase